MGSVDTELLSSLFLLPKNIAIEAVYPTKTHLTVQVACLLKSAACPLCQQPSERIHGSYGRTVADVPCGGRKVTLALTVRKFVQAEAYPEMHHPKRGARRSLLDPYKRHILQRWQQGCRNRVQRYDEIKARGFTGSAPLLRMFLAELRKKHQEAGAASVLTLDASTQAIEIPPSLPPSPRITCRMSATRAS